MYRPTGAALLQIESVDSRGKGIQNIKVGPETCQMCLKFLYLECIEESGFLARQMAETVWK